MSFLPSYRQAGTFSRPLPLRAGRCRAENPPRARQHLFSDCIHVVEVAP